MPERDVSGSTPPANTHGWWNRFRSNDSGGESVEWPLLVALVLLIAIGAWSEFQDILGTMLMAIIEAVVAVLD
ncbi:hypothetical protein [Thiocapsa roseopersicina]|uniref:Uncharacterized protein n=1 Tax=Thiocapsa roseopersicina TaxID=1058 RepID=A0A1H3BRM8_THIRO|nr:hypothetical protein [Thiocapsa roseopersicina]SDX44388.1 hypothetical protein SAMN05421783_12640 [Thiocapsa roseopersicina]